jgi:hypothetical protein
LAPIPFRQASQFLFEEIQSKVLFRFEIIEEGALGNFCFRGDLLRCRLEEPLLRKQLERGAKNFLLRSLLVLRSLRRALPPFASFAVSPYNS